MTFQINPSSKKLLESLYVEQRLTIAELAVAIGVSPPTAASALRRAGVSVRQRGTSPLPRDPSPIGNGDWAVPLSNGMRAIISEESVDRVRGHLWTACKCRNTYYAKRRGKKRLGEPSKVYLHHVVLAPPDGMVIDHINGDGLDNRRSNLRVATQTENSQARRPNAGFSTRGVKWNKVHRRWQATIQCRNKRQHLGFFKDRTQACLAYNQRATELFGDFAKLNPI